MENCRERSMLQEGVKREKKTKQRERLSNWILTPLNHTVSSQDKREQKKKNRQMARQTDAWTER